MSRVDGVPRWTLLALTPTTLHALACAQHGTRWAPEEVFATFDRARIRATVHAGVNVRVLTIEDPDDRAAATGGRVTGSGRRTPRT